MFNNKNNIIDMVRFSEGTKKHINELMKNAFNENGDINKLVMAEVHLLLESIKESLSEEFPIVKECVFIVLFEEKVPYLTVLITEDKRKNEDSLSLHEFPHGETGILY